LTLSAVKTYKISNEKLKNLIIYLPFFKKKTQKRVVVMSLYLCDSLQATSDGVQPPSWAGSGSQATPLPQSGGSFWNPSSFWKKFDCKD
jgi:hypothetical protein